MLDWDIFRGKPPPLLKKFSQVQDEGVLAERKIHCISLVSVMKISIKDGGE